MPALTALLRPLCQVLCCLAAALISTQAWAAPPTLDQCHGIKDLAFVAHLDDDLLFMNPDVASNIEAGGCVRVVYLTASDAGEGEGYMLGRERGVRAAYAYMAREADAWQEDTGIVAGRQIARFTLQGNPRVQLWHMRLKDPWLGKGWGSLTPLSRTESEPGQNVDTLGPHAEVYSREQLVDTLAEMIRQYGPTTVRHLDDTISVPYTQLCWRCAGHGHPDHIASARLAREAMVRAPGNYAETGYIDYPSQERATNLADAEIASKSVIFQHYAWNDYHYCAGPTGCKEPARRRTAALCTSGSGASRLCHPAKWCAPRGRRDSPFLGGLAIAAGFGWTSTGWVGSLLALASLPLWLWAVMLERRARTARAGKLVVSTESAR